MKRVIILFSICVLNLTGCPCQTPSLLSFFKEIQTDSIVNTLDFGQKNIYKIDIADPISIYYFFNNDEENLYDTGEAYNMDDNTYTKVRYKRTVTAVFSKTIDSITILCYWLDRVNYLAIYNKTKDTIVSTYPFCIYTVAVGESFTHSMLFPNNYIFSIETTDETTVNTKVKLIEIDYVNDRFIEHKNVMMESAIYIEDMQLNNEKYQRALELVGISKTGELLEKIDNQFNGI